MKIAIVHDWLNQKIGGAENVLFELTKMYPKADIYTLIYNPDLFNKQLANRKVFTSVLNAFPGYLKRRPQLLLPFIMHAVKKWDFSDYDLVISSSTAWVKNINITGQAKHICYCHSPARMIWDSWPSYLDKFKLGPLRRFYIIRLASKLRLWDYYQAQNGTIFIANSKYVATRIKKFYHQQAKVIYPPVKLAAPKTVVKKDDYYLIVSVLAKYKNIDLAVKAFMASGKKLVIAGNGPDAERLQAIASGSDNIEFVGRVNEQTKQRLYTNAKAFVFCSVEDFGITMVEAISAGTPVIALRGGGANEIIHEGKTGVFYNEANEQSLNKSIMAYEKSPISKGSLQNDYIKMFDTNEFIQEINKVVAREFK